MRRIIAVKPESFFAKKAGRHRKSLRALVGRAG
jgi:hypothetical protein